MTALSKRIGCGVLVLAGLLAGAIGVPSMAAQGGDPPPSTVTAGGITLKSVNIELPTSDRTFPGGDAAQAITDNCTACHSPGMVLTQPAMSRAAWQAEVDKMRGTFKAPVADEDVPAIVGYLASHKGTP
ncbi:MAG: hypothetical protein P4L71_17770 [Acetobacteraceae bacterium]|nr:hypothetical protein [Acetobacteraceae bacterium]